ncbi:hypothetical protein HPB47_026388 [Ixodes persulcatus]|uniref:Uncharacterized protein n=1 Tax=Ixodes persulcatus TaxID=34615 RepID=A0AC60Q1A1_IXOPE|nr:hypothetical protein HPB47_026388 [Ixodes persulcatus]
MERMKRPLSDICTRQLRRRVAAEVQKELSDNASHANSEEGDCKLPCKETGATGISDPERSPLERHSPDTMPVQEPDNVVSEDTAGDYDSDVPSDWLETTPPASPPSDQVEVPHDEPDRVSADLLHLQDSTPTDFNRKPRSFQELDYWKAAEHRNFLIYFGPVVLKGHLESKFYRHFLKLSCAVTILASPKLCMERCDDADRLLREFVVEAGALYGKGIYVYNVHSLVHLAQDVRMFGSLDSFSAFPFENFLGQMKKLLRSPSLPLQQIVRRISELQPASSTRPAPQVSCALQGPHNDGPTPPDFHGKEYKKCVMVNTILSTKNADRCVRVSDGNIVLIENFLEKDCIMTICGKAFTTVKNLYSSPLSSSDLSVYEAGGLSHSYSLWNVNDVLQKSAMFSIVHFTDTDDVALVPTTWVSNGRTGWPSYRNPARLTKSVKDREEMGDDWKTFSCRVLSVTDSYEVGKERERRAEETSDLATGDETSSQRRKRRPARLLSSSEDEEDEPVLSRPRLQASNGAGNSVNGPQDSFQPPPPPPRMLAQQASGATQAGSDADCPGSPSRKCCQGY